MIKFSALILSIIMVSVSARAQYRYPETRATDQQDDYHGTKVSDPYRWLENDTSPETKRWVTEQNRVTQKYLSGIPFRNRIRQRITELYKYERISVPFRRAGYIYYYKNDGLQNQSVLYRQKGMDGKPEVVIDPNKLSADATTRLAEFKVSKDGRYAAWSISRAGSDWQTIYVKDLANLQDLPDSLEWVKVSKIAWHGNGFFYSRYPEPAKGQELSFKNENHQVWFHTAGTSQASDRLIYEDKSNLQRFHLLETDDDEKYAVLSVSDRGKGIKGNALRFMRLGSAGTAFSAIVGQPGEYDYSFIGLTPEGHFLIKTNEGALNNRIITVDPSDPGSANWKTLVPETGRPFDKATTAGGKIFVRYLQDVSSRMEIFDMNGNHADSVKFPALGTAEGFDGSAGDSDVFYAFTSFTYPTVIYRYDIAGRKSEPFRQPKLLFDPKNYVTSQEFYTSKDGTRVPVFIIHKAGIKRDGSNPTLLYGYGGFNVNIVPNFNVTVIPFLEEGGIYAVANIRGGGEYGEKWHEAGMFGRKQNVFDDFIAAAEFLITQKYTSPAKLAVRGGSNGGTLVGAVINQRPELFRVAIPEVGVMDMLRFHKFTIGWNWIAEYGSSDKPEDFKFLYAYSPLHNIRAGKKYPAVLITTADHDDRVVPAHSFKYAATLQEKYKGPNPALIRIATNSGHGSSNIQKNIEIAADVYSFILFNLK